MKKGDKITRLYYGNKEVAGRYDSDRQSEIGGRKISELQKKTVLSLLELSKLKHKRVLDVGCGTGKYSSVLSKYAKCLVGLDINRNMLNNARNKDKKSSYIEGSIFNLPFKENSFDLSVCILVISHLENYKRAIKEICRVTKESIIFGVPNKKSLLSLSYLYRFIKEGSFRYSTNFNKSYKGKLRPYSKFFSDNELKRLVKEEGFNLSKIKTCQALMIIPNYKDYPKLVENIDKRLCNWNNIGSFIAIRAENGKIRRIKRP